MPPVFSRVRDPALNNAHTFCAVKEIGARSMCEAESQLWKQIRNWKYGNPHGPNQATCADQSIFRGPAAESIWTSLYATILHFFVLTFPDSSRLSQQNTIVRKLQSSSGVEFRWNTDHGRRNMDYMEQGYTEHGYGTKTAAITYDSLRSGVPHGEAMPGIEVGR